MENFERYRNLCNVYGWKFTYDGLKQFVLQEKLEIRTGGKINFPIKSN